MPEFVEVFEVGPRDGLQNEAAMIATRDKVSLVERLSDCGFRRIEVASFVSPKWVPQMADGAAVLAAIRRRHGVGYAALTPNMRGFEAALGAGVDEVAIFGSASEGFSRANINCSIDESLARFRPVAEAAKAANIRLRGYVSCVTDCPYDGKVAPGDVARVAAALMAMGCHEVSLGDTIGQGTPESVTAMLGAVMEVVPVEKLAGHFHDTGGRALENIEASLALGVRVFDAAAALGLPVKLHSGQLSNLGGAALAASYGALSVDHLEHLDDAGIAAMAHAGTVAVLLPGAFYTLHETQMPPVSALREAGVPIAIATDANPGSSPLYSPLLAMNMAATLFRLTPQEALLGVTQNAARALGQGDDTGSLEAGKRADLAVWDVAHPAELSYRFGFNPLWKRIIGGKI